ncbi:hypothetical protein BT93_A1469 [Corymbia citriodora subsp. variegata]|nr:hypothetical protein BT93_A1469 [Corymbia citriodora subsp. variegata]
MFFLPGNSNVCCCTGAFRLLPSIPSNFLATSPTRKAEASPQQHQWTTEKESLPSSTRRAARLLRLRRRRCPWKGFFPAVPTREASLQVQPRDAGGFGLKRASCFR